MFSKSVEKFVDVLLINGIGKKEDKEIIVFGLMSGIKLILNILTTILLGLIFGLVIESLLFLISFSFIRTYTGGYHAKSAINCYLFSSVVVVLVLIAIKFTPAQYVFIASILILLISVPILLKFAPVEARTKPLDEIERKYFRKKGIINLSIECILIFIMFILRFNKLGYIVSLGILVSAILVFMEKFITDIYNKNNIKDI